MKNIIHIFGASGAGTSTLGRYICDQLGYTLLDVDDYFWMPTDIPFTVRRDVKEREIYLKKDIDAADNAVITGSLLNWSDDIVSQLSLAIRLVTDTEERLRRLQAREAKEYGSRILPGGDMHQQFQGFLARAAEYDNGDIFVRSKQLHDEWQKLLHCNVLVLSGEDSPEQNFEVIAKELAKCKQPGVSAS